MCQKTSAITKAHPRAGANRNRSYLRKPFQPRKQVRFHQTRTRVISRRGATGKARQNPVQGPVYGLMEQDDLEACKSELSISTASQNTPTANRPKAHAPATERTVITIFRRSAFALH